MLVPYPLTDIWAVYSGNSGFSIFNWADEGSGTHGLEAEAGREPIQSLQLNAQSIAAKSPTNASWMKDNSLFNEFPDVPNVTIYMLARTMSGTSINDVFFTTGPDSIRLSGSTTALKITYKGLQATLNNLTPATWYVISAAISATGIRFRANSYNRLNAGGTQIAGLGSTNISMFSDMLGNNTGDKQIADVAIYANANHDLTTVGNIEQLIYTAYDLIKTPVVTLPVIPNKLVTDLPFQLTATTDGPFSQFGQQMLPFNWSSSNPAVATVSSTGLVTIVGVGTTNISVNQVAGTGYNISNTVVQPLTVTAADTTAVITFPVIPNKVVGDADFSPGATSNSPAPIVYTSSDITVAKIVGNVIRIVGPGTVTIFANQGAITGYTVAAQQSRTFNVTNPIVDVQAVITFPALVTKRLGDPDFFPGAFSNSPAPITYTSSNPAVATIVGGMIHIVGVGTTVITASQGAVTGFTAAADVTQGLTVEASDASLGNIDAEPSTNSIHSVYRPIIFRVTATRTGGGPVPPVVYCDIYINDVFYKTIAKTQYTSKTAADSLWTFDVHDALQEYCRKFIEANGEPNILQVPLISLKCYCKFRSSDIDTEGFIVPEGVVPIQGTIETPPVSGNGFQSHTFYGVNATLQHEENQNLALHLTAYKHRTWDSNTFPLSHRPDYYRVCEEDSDSFAILSDKRPTKLAIVYQLEDGTTGELDSGVLCQPTGMVGTPGVINAQNDVPFNFITTLTGTAPFTLNIIQKPAWLSIALVGNEIRYSGTPVGQDTTIPHYIRLEVTNCDVTPFPIVYQMFISSSLLCIVPTISNTTMITGAVGNPYNHSHTVNGSLPLTLFVQTKPAWMTITVSGNQVLFSGTPGIADISAPQMVIYTVANACGSIQAAATFRVLTLSQTVNIINDTGFDITLSNSNGFFTIPPGGGTMPMTNNIFIIENMVAVHDIDFHDSLSNPPIFQEAAAIQGTIVSTPSLANFSYIWFKP